MPGGRGALAKPSRSDAAQMQNTFGRKDKIVRFIYSEDGQFEAREGQIFRNPVKILDRLEKLKIMSTLSEYKVLSTLEKYNVFSLIEPYLPLLQKYKILSLTEGIINIDRSWYATNGWLALFFGPVFTILLPKDNGVEVALAALFFLGSGAIGVASWILWYFVKIIQEEDYYVDEGDTFGWGNPLLED